ncbi:unnamed protein product, partial [Medioppia subpectinata]
ALVTVAKPKVICYWPNWRVDSGGDDRHVPENIDPTLCTHIHHAFHVYDQQHNVVRDSAGPQPDLYRRLHALKSKNPDVKVIVSMGGWGQPDAQYSHLVADEGLRLGFIKNTIAYLHKYQFDGLDIDWEFPVCWAADCNKGPKADKPNFATLLRELRQAFDKENPRLSLSAALGSTEDIAQQAYDFNALAQTLDYASIMTYDWAGPWEGKTDHHSKYQQCINMANWFASKGLPKDKICMGVPFYGHTFNLKNAGQHWMGAPITGSGKTPHGEGDNAWYREMCDLVKNKGWAKEDPDQGHDPISYHGTTWVGYDDPYAAYE